ncbi:YczE/YyaS/YitT family protein [Prauserella rugosa]|uniref:membrane protein YczE n=1 Tax=Prauserella rugosa TaxID=43354 RepID=UPI0004C39CF8|nr:membrane protein [Prauserella rugosa]
MASTAQVELHPVTVRRDPARRLIQLVVGLLLFGTSMAMMSRSLLGLNPWDVLHEGLMHRTGLTFGTVTVVTAVTVLLLWIPLRQRPGIGTIANVVLIAVSVDVVRLLLPVQEHLATQIPLLLGGIVLNGFATALYVGARLGPGPRDGLFTGLTARTGLSVRLVRTLIEVCVLATGWLLGGTAGLGTILFAVSIGPLTQLFLPWVVWRPRS